MKLCLTLSMLSFSGFAVADSTTALTPVAVADPSPTTATKSTYDWTGVYVGAYVGGASGANATSSTNGSLNLFGSPDPAYSASGSRN